MQIEYKQVLEILKNDNIKLLYVQLYYKINNAYLELYDEDNNNDDSEDNNRDNLLKVFGSDDDNGDPEDNDDLLEEVYVNITSNITHEYIDNTHHIRILDCDNDVLTLVYDKSKAIDQILNTQFSDKCTSLNDIFNII